MRLFRSTRPGRVTSPFRARLSAEALESRDGPAGLSAGLTPVGGDPAYTAWSPGGSDDAVGMVQPPANAAPRITEFRAVEQQGGIFLFTGRVVDEAPAGLTVTFGGSVPSAKGLTATTGAGGSFSILIKLKQDGTDAGTVTAQTQDTQGLPSNVATADVTPSPPKP